jgi:hypothetical protein
MQLGRRVGDAGHKPCMDNRVLYIALLEDQSLLGYTAV